MTRAEIEERVKEFLIEDLEIEPEKISPEANLKEDLEIDSLDFVDIVVIVEKKFGFKIKRIYHARLLAAVYEKGIAAAGVSVRKFARMIGECALITFAAGAPARAIVDQCIFAIAGVICRIRGRLLEVSAHMPIYRIVREEAIR